MPFSVSDVVLGGLLPIAVTWMIVGLCGRFRADWNAVPLAAAAGLIAAVFALQLTPWVPSTHWHWLPAACAAAALVGTIAELPRIRPVVAWVLTIALAAGCGWLLVPARAGLEPSGPAQMVTFALYVIVLSRPLERIGQRLDGPLLPALEWFALSGGAVVLALCGSLRFAQIGIAAAAVFFALLLISLFRRRIGFMRGTAPLYAVAATGCMLVGRANSFSNVPLASYLLIPLAPLPLCFVSSATDESGTVWRRKALLVGIALAIVGLAVGLAVAAEMGGDEY